MFMCQAGDEQGRGGLQGRLQGGSQGPSALQGRSGTPMLTTPLERALVRLLATGYALNDAAPSLGLSVGEARTLLGEIQGRAGVPNETRLIVLAVLNAWV